MERLCEGEMELPGANVRKQAHHLASHAKFHTMELNKLTSANLEWPILFENILKKLLAEESDSFCWLTKKDYGIAPNGILDRAIVELKKTLNIEFNDFLFFPSGSVDMELGMYKYELISINGVSYHPALMIEEGLANELIRQASYLLTVGMRDSSYIDCDLRSRINNMSQGPAIKILNECDRLFPRGSFQDDDDIIGQLEAEKARGLERISMKLKLTILPALYRIKKSVDDGLIGSVNDKPHFESSKTLNTMMLFSGNKLANNHVQPVLFCDTESHHSDDNFISMNISKRP